MYGREKLEEFYGCYNKYEADKVMDAMERRIARLTALVEGWKRNSVVLGEMYKSRLAMEQARTNELEVALSNAVTGGKIALEQAKKFEATISKMETTTPKWISVKDRLPKENEVILVFFRSLKYSYQLTASFECGSFLDIGGGSLAPTHWMPLPPPPTTEEK